MYKTKKQKKAFNCIKNGISLARHFNIIVRFLTLTTSDLQKNNIDYSPLLLNYNFEKLRNIIRRTKINDLLKNDYIKNSDIRKFYPNKKLNDTFIFDYFKVKTNEGNGVLHILYKGDYIPYNYLVDIWNDLHNSWNISIQIVKTDERNAIETSDYVVTQYLSNQKSSYQRSSQSWLWTIRGYYKKFYEFATQCKRQYFYNPVQRRYYKNRKEIDFFDLWFIKLIHLLKPPNHNVQVALEVF